MRSLRSLSLPLAALLPLGLLTGCALTPTAIAPVQTAAIVAQGTVHGGQSPVTGSHVHLIEINSTKSAAAVSLITATGNTVTNSSDSIGYYVPTDGGGGFTLTGEYTCVSGGQVYVLATQGNPGLTAGTNNTALAEMATLGTCGTTGTFSSSTYITVNEASTVAAVYSMAGYLTGPAAVSGNTSTLAQTGLANAFNTAQTIVGLSTGKAATSYSSGTVPAAKINLLANIIAACINSNGGTGTPCATLFATATSNGLSTGTQPADTVTALLNIAHHPGSNVAALYQVASATGPFQPTTTTQPTDLTLAISLPAYLADDPVSPNQLSIDASGNVFFPGYFEQGEVFNAFTFDTLGNFSHASGAQFGNSAYLENGFQMPIDPSGNAWYNASTSATGFGVYSPTSGNVTTHNATAIGYGYATVSDASGNLYVADYQNQRMDLVNNSGTLTTQLSQSNGISYTGVAVDNQGFFYLAGPGSNVLYANSAAALNSTNLYGATYLATGSNGGLNAPRSLALDASGNIWVANSNSTLSEFQPTDYYTTSGGVAYQTLYLTPVSTSAGYMGGGLSFSAATTMAVPIVFDGASDAWVPNYAGQSISEFSNAGVALSPATTGYATGCPAQGVAVDGSGNVWVACANLNGTRSSTAIEKFIGLATPVYTPILPGHYGVRP